MDVYKQEKHGLFESLKYKRIHDGDALRFRQIKRPPQWIVNAFLKEKITKCIQSSIHVQDKGRDDAFSDDDKGFVAARLRTIRVPLLP
jgi:hypothetical protein